MFETASVKAILTRPNFTKPKLTRDIRRLERDILRMGALVEKSFRLSHQALFARELSVVEQLPLLDKKNSYYFVK